MSTVQVGNAGEHYVMACLLARGIHAGLADRGNPHFDILVRNESGDFRAIRVKTTNSASFQWNAKEDWNPLPGFDKDKPDPRDVSILVAFNKKPPGPDTEVYVIPTARLVEDLNRVIRHWRKFKKRDGSERKRRKHRAIWLNGNKTKTNIAGAFRDDWRDFREAWHLLEGTIQ